MHFIYTLTLPRVFFHKTSLSLVTTSDGSTQQLRFLGFKDQGGCIKYIHSKTPEQSRGQETPPRNERADETVKNIAGVRAKMLVSDTP